MPRGVRAPVHPVLVFFLNAQTYVVVVVGQAHRIGQHQDHAFVGGTAPRRGLQRAGGFAQGAGLAETVRLQGRAGASEDLEQMMAGRAGRRDRGAELRQQRFKRALRQRLARLRETPLVD